jgi:hypothetical protein
MRYLAAFVVLVLLAAQASSQQPDQKPQGTQSKNGGGAIVYSEGGAFLIEGPKGWTTDHEVGQELGVCCVFYPEGTTWDNAQTVMYPNVVTKGPGQKTLKEFMDHDVADFREHNPGMTYVDGEDLPLNRSRTAKLRYFYGVNKNSAEAVAYVDEDKIIAVIVASSRTTKALNDSIPLLRTVLRTYAYMDVKFAKGAKPATGQPFKLPND